MSGMERTIDELYEDDPERAILAALSMQRAFDLYVREQLQPEAADLRMRVGVNTGEVIAAVGGDRQQWQEAAMGMAVAVAARMEAAAEPARAVGDSRRPRALRDSSGTDRLC